MKRVRSSKWPPKINIKVVYANLKQYDNLDNMVLDKYSVDLTNIFITADGKYLIHDPPVSDYELEEISNKASDLLFLIPDNVPLREDELRKIINDFFGNDKYSYLLMRELIGYSALYPAIKDPYVEDIQIPGPSTPARIMHSLYGPLISNIVFNESELDSLVERLVHISGKSVSIYQPMLSVRLPDGHRLTVTYKREIGYKGSTITIRKFPERPWSITMLLEKNTINPLVAAWLMLLIERRKAILVTGAMGTGKTSLINALTNMIPERASVITIEDTPELKLAHPYWIPLITRESYSLDERGTIDMFKLVKHALRMSADYIIIGEVRGEEARIWANALLSGHGGLTSFHAESAISSVQRLISDPLKVEPGSLIALRNIVVLRRLTVRREDKGFERKLFLRRIVDVYDLEINGRNVILNRLFHYNTKSDRLEVVSIDKLLNTYTARMIMDETGWSKSELLENLMFRAKFIEYLRREAKLHNELYDYRVVTQMFWKFYEDQHQFKNVENIELELYECNKESIERVSLEATRND